MKFGILFFSDSSGRRADDKYALLTAAAKYADTQGFTAIWTPERHFHQFGGLFPNPSVVSAALAVLTKNLEIRAGSLISPLHHWIRIAEDWAVVDNLSGGRVAISFGAGWNVDDFVIFPDRYPTRRTLMFEQIEAVRRWWRGESVTQLNSFGKEIDIHLHPEPVQKELPVWLTSSGNKETFIDAGAIGANILTHLIGQTSETLAEKIQCYRESRERHGFAPQQGIVTLMLHTFIGGDRNAVREKVRIPFRQYLRAAVSLEEKAAAGGGVISGGHKIDRHNIPDSVMDDLLDITFERYFSDAALMGAIPDCLQTVRKLAAIGVDEIACLIDFLDDHDAILESLTYVNRLREMVAAESESRLRRESAEALAFLEDLES